MCKEFLKLNSKRQNNFKNGRRLEYLFLLRRYTDGGKHRNKLDVIRETQMKPTVQRNVA